MARRQPLATTGPDIVAEEPHPQRGQTALWLREFAASGNIRARQIASAVQLIGVGSFIVGGFYLGAWFTGDAARWAAGTTITMKTNAALAFVLSGCALLLLGRESTTHSRCSAGVIVSAIVLLIGGTTLFEHLFRLDLGLDQLLATELPGAAATVSPNRMGLPASSSFALLALGMVALASRRHRAIAPFIGLGVCFINLVPAVGYVLGIDAFYGRAVAGIAWPTVVTLLSLSVGLILSVRDSGPLAVLLRPDAGGMFLRKVLPWALLVPLVLAFLRVQGQRAGLYDTYTGTGLLVIGLVLFFSMFLWRSAAHLGDAVSAQVQAYEALRESDARAGAVDARLRAHVEATPLAVVEWDADYRVTRFSRRAEEIFGWSADEVVGRRLDEIPWVPEEDWPAVRVVMRDMSNGARPTTVSNNRNRRKDGSIIYCEWYNSTISNDSGRLVSVLSLVLDVSERRRSEEALRRSEQQFRALVTASSDVLYSMSPDWSVMRRLRSGDFIADTLEPTTSWLEKYIHPDDHPRVKAAIEKAIRTKSPFELEHRVLRVDGSLGWTFSRAIPLLDADNVIIEWFGAATDVTDRKLAEARSESLARFPEENPDPVLRIDSDCVVLYANEPARRLLRPLVIENGLSAPAELAGLARQALVEGRRLRTEMNCGNAVFSMSFVPVAKEVNVYAHDVSARKRAEAALRESEQRYRTMGETLPYGVWLCNPEGGAEYVSQSFLDLLEMTPEQMREFGWTHRLPPEDVQPMLDKWLQCVRTGTPWDSEHRILGPDGKYHHVLTRGLPVRDAEGKITCWVGINLDIDHRKQTEEELRTADRRKSEFLAMLSHELRNPLAPIRNSVFVLERAAAGSEQAARARDVIRRQTEHLTRLVDDLLDMTRITSGKITLHCERIDLREIVRKITDDLLSVFHQNEVELRFEPVVGPVWVDADTTRIAQVVGNLLQNAVKFTPPGGTVIVAIGAIRGRAEICIRDTGVGIDPDQVEKMFEPFAQADQSLARTQGGLGLGLSLVRGLIELHGGSVRASSEGRGRGSEFVVSLPLAGMGAKNAQPAPELGLGSGQHILVIEDNVDAGQSLADVLELAGHRVRVARDGRSGIALVRELKPDVVLCDIGLPDIDGYEVVRTLRADQALAGIRIIALTGYAQPEDVQRAKAAGFDGHLPKPAPLDELNELLASHR